MTYEEEINERVIRAVENFMEGYNCAQSVVTAFADLYGFTHEQALHMSASFGGGMGRMRLVCGACCGLMQLAGLEICALEGKDNATKSANYALVQKLAGEFKEEHGTMICSELLGLRKNAPVTAVADERTAQYYAKRPCARMVESAARIWARHLIEKHNA